MGKNTKTPPKKDAKSVQPANAKKEKVGFIFECGRDGADYHVASHFLGKLNERLEIVPVFMDHAEKLLQGCGEVAAGLLKECSRVVIMWDLIPTWDQRKPCRHQDKENALRSLRGAKVDIRKVIFMCVEQELECWLMADERAVAAALYILKSKHSPENVLEFKNPDVQIKKPKSELISLFVKELGRGRKYADRAHAMMIASRITDWTRIRRSESFRRFASKVAGVTI